MLSVARKKVPGLSSMLSLAAGYGNLEAEGMVLTVTSYGPPGDRHGKDGGCQMESEHMTGAKRTAENGAA